MNHFKQFNDNFGHQIGDQVLRLVGLSVKQNVKAQDIACRYGGEEFAVILPRTELDHAFSVVEHIHKSVICKELVKRSTGENLGRITISIGVGGCRALRRQACGAQPREVREGHRYQERRRLRPTRFPRSDRRGSFFPGRFPRAAPCVSGAIAETTFRRNPTLLVSKS
ncbi:GGDEF domain-containing protein [Breoghania sp.]|uniref:GGDEF domain-containing protein n=1 Tax=Breoghania sp. TaxID=2065378 RepID=UPI0032047727